MFCVIFWGRGIGILGGENPPWRYIAGINTSSEKITFICTFKPSTTMVIIMSIMTNVYKIKVIECSTTCIEEIGSLQIFSLHSI